VLASSALLAAAAVSATVGSGPYLWTDVPEIAERGLISDSAGSLLHSLLLGIPGQYYRPTVFLLHTLTFWSLGDDVLAFRIENLAIHLVNAGLVYLLLSKVTEKPRQAAVAAILFALHPVAATPLAWISDRTDLVALGSSLGSALLLLHYLQRGATRTLLASLGLLLFGLGAKETSVGVLLVTAGVYACSPRHRGPLLARALAAESGLVLLWFLWRRHVETNLATIPTDLTAIERVALAASIHLGYVRQLLIPSLLSACDAVRVPAHAGVWALATLTAGALGVAAMVRVARANRYRTWALVLLWTFAFLVPTSGVLMLKHARADRYLYCALPGMAFLAVAAANGCCNRLRLPSWPRFGLALAGALYLASGLTTRAEHFSSDQALWFWEVDENPDCREGWANLMRDAYVGGDLALARSALARLEPYDKQLAAFWDPRSAQYYKALIAIDDGDLTGAVATLSSLASDAVHDKPSAEASYMLGLLRLGAGDYQGASGRLTSALAGRLPPASQDDALLLRSYARFKLGEHDGARADFHRYAAHPIHQQSRGRLAMADELRAAYGE
jgi:hypothetical protein